MSNTTAFAEYLQHDTDFYMDRPSKEEGHTKRCLANAMICAVENLRDDDGWTDHDFRLAAQGNFVLSAADEYLDSELCDCLCPQRLRMDQYYWTINLFAYEGAVITDTIFGTLPDVIAEVEDIMATDDDVQSALVGRCLFTYGESDKTDVFWMSTSHGKDVA